MAAAENYAFVRGMRDTRSALALWNERPWPVVRRWVAGSLIVAFALLAATWAVAISSTPGDVRFIMPGLQVRPRLGAVGHVLARNSLVLALHALACVAGFIAGSSLPLQAQARGGSWVRTHDIIGRGAIAFVAAATLFSLGTQALSIGAHAATLAHQLGISPLSLLFGLLPHALPELTALFLPLAAWLFAARRGAFEELLAATAVTVAIAVPVLVLASIVEVYVSPHLIAWLAGGPGSLYAP